MLQINISLQTNILIIKYVSQKKSLNCTNTRTLSIILKITNEIESRTCNGANLKLNAEKRDNYRKCTTYNYNYNSGIFKQFSLNFGFICLTISIL